MVINSDFATEAVLTYSFTDKNILVRLTDEHDIRTLKDILKGHPMRDTPSCGFSTDVSITMTDGSKSIVFCPANDGCPLIRIGDSDRYIAITDEARARLNEVLEKYDMIFPCI